MIFKMGTHTSIWRKLDHAAPEKENFAYALGQSEAAATRVSPQISVTHRRNPQ